MRRAVLALALVALALGGAALAGAQTADPTVTPVGLSEVPADGSEAASVTATDTPDDANVGAYRLNLSYDSDVATVTASSTDTFAVRTSNPEPGVLTVVGYTDQSTTSGGDLPLASLTLAGESAGESDLDVHVERFTDTNGTTLPYSVSNTTFEVTAEGSTTTNTTTTTSSGGGGGGGGFFFPAPGGETTTETAATTTTTTTTTTTEEPTTTTEEPPTTTATTESTTTSTDGDAGSGGDETQTSGSGGTPGFGVPVALLALLVAGALALRSRP